jgi:hypothetical protein
MTEYNKSIWREKLLKFIKFDKFNDVSSFIDYLEKGIDKEFIKDRFYKLPPIPIEYLPVDMGLRRSSLVRNIYENIFPVTHVFRVTFKYKGEFFDEFMPISNEDYIGRGSYKFVYRLPWNQVLKVGKSKFPSDPLFGSLFKKVSKDIQSYIKPEEYQLYEYYYNKNKSSSYRDKLIFNFRRLGLERLHYWKIKTLLPDLVLPTRHFMGQRFRKGFLNFPMVHFMPCDNQTLIPGKHLKEFVLLKERLNQNFFQDLLSPSWKLDFNYEKYGEVSRQKIKKIAFNFHRVIEATRYLSEKENLILDLHSENIIIMLPEYELKIFDFHLFDNYLYDLGNKEKAPLDEHIDTINQFISSFQLSKKELSESFDN